MMKFVSMLTKEFNVPTVVSLNTIMIDGTGMCGRVAGCFCDEGPKFVCVDGPEFDGHKIDWDSLLSRQRIYLNEERITFENARDYKDAYFRDGYSLKRSGDKDK